MLRTFSLTLWALGWGTLRNFSRGKTHSQSYIPESSLCNRRRPGLQVRQGSSFSSTMCYSRAHGQLLNLSEHLCARRMKLLTLQGAIVKACVLVSVPGLGRVLGGRNAQEGSRRGMEVSLPDWGEGRRGDRGLLEKLALEMSLERRNVAMRTEPERAGAR